MQSRVNSRIRFARCSTTSWPLTASTIVRPPTLRVTLSRSQPTSRLPSLATLKLVSLSWSDEWMSCAKVSSWFQSFCCDIICRICRFLRYVPARSERSLTNRSVLFCVAAFRDGSITISSSPTSCLSTVSGTMISAKFVGIARVGQPVDRRPGRDDLRRRRLDHAAEQRVVRRGPDAAVHQARDAELELVLELEPALTVEQPERTGRRGHGRHGAVEELHVEFRRLDVRLRQFRDLPHELADLVLRLLEQTGIDGFFRHGVPVGRVPGVGCLHHKPRRAPDRRWLTVNGTTASSTFPGSFENPSLPLPNNGDRTP